MGNKQQTKSIFLQRFVVDHKIMRKIISQDYDNQGQVLLLENVSLYLLESQYQKLNQLIIKRKSMHRNVLKIYNLKIIETAPKDYSKQVCCQKHQYIQLQYQYCVPLKQIKSNQYQTLYLLIAILYGFSNIYFQAIQNNWSTKKWNGAITMQMIRINMRGEVRVWWSQDPLQFADIQPGGKFLGERQIVFRIFQLIYNNKSYDIPNCLKSFIKFNLKNDPSFDQAIIVLKQFCRVNNFRIPVRVQSLKKSLSTQKKQYYAVPKMKPRMGQSVLIKQNLSQSQKNQSSTTTFQRSKKQPYSYNQIMQISKRKLKCKNQISQSFRIHQPNIPQQSPQYFKYLRDSSIQIQQNQLINLYTFYGAQLDSQNNEQFNKQKYKSQFI